MGDLFKTNSAIMSECGDYRYCLTRRWSDGPTCGFIMLNPSTADADRDDPTIRRCISFAKREGCGGLIVVNLFAFRATSPKEMMCAYDPIGPENNWNFKLAIEEIDGPIIAAWGNDGAFLGKGAAVAWRHGGVLKCFGHTRSGQPKHPLYVPGDAPLIPLVGP